MPKIKNNNDVDNFSFKLDNYQQILLRNSISDKKKVIIKNEDEKIY